MITVRRPQNGLLVLGHDPDNPEAVIPTRQCAHCGGHYPFKVPKLDRLLGPEEAAAMERAGKEVRGTCQLCGGWVCGVACATCVPCELMLENTEKGRPLDYRPVVVPAFGGAG